MRFPSKSEVPTETCSCSSTQHADRKRAFDAAREQWPALGFGFDQYCAHLTRLGYADALPHFPSSVYLCCACSSVGNAACRVLEAAYFPALRSFIAKFDARPEIIEDLLQQLRARLFVGPKARILTYKGKGALQGWLRGVARSVAVDFIRVRKARREDSWYSTDSDVTGTEYVCASPSYSPEDDYVYARYTDTVMCGLQRAMGALDGEDRQLLHHYFVSGLTIDALAPLYAVNRSTIARRIQRNVGRVRRELRREVTPQLGPFEPGELESWAPIVFHRLNVDAGALLAD